MNPIKFLRALFEPRRCADCACRPDILFHSDDGKRRCVQCECDYFRSRPVPTLELD